MQRVSIYDKMTISEKEVADLLKEMGIKWSYEHPVFVWDENKRPRVWAPDFYLIPFGIYVGFAVQKVLITIIGRKYSKIMVIELFFYICIKRKISGYIILFVI